MVPIKILLATPQAVISEVANELKAFDVIQTSNFEHAREIIAKNNISLFIIGVYFDDSNAVNLIRFIRAIPEHRDTPMIAIRCMKSDNVEALRIAVAAMQPVYQMYPYLELEGDPDAGDRLRNAVRLRLENLTENDTDNQ